MTVSLTIVGMILLFAIWRSGVKLWQLAIVVIAVVLLPAAFSTGVHNLVIQAAHSITQAVG